MMIVAQHPSESLAPSDRVVNLANVGDGLQQTVSKSLMIALAVVMGNQIPLAAKEAMHHFDLRAVA
jgi:hypothetical protein